jgi:hypothetical protein
LGGGGEPAIVPMLAGSGGSKLLAGLMTERCIEVEGLMATILVALTKSVALEGERRGGESAGGK